MTRADVVIVGGGFVGLAAAAALANGQRRVLVLEARRGRDTRFRGELIHPLGAKLLSELGLLADVAHEGSSVDGFAIIPGADQAASVLPYSVTGASASTGFAMEHNAMVDGMRRKVAALAGVEIRAGERVLGLLRNSDRVAGVQTADEEIRAGLTVIADGRHSKLRRELGIADRTELLSFTAAVLVKDAALPHPGHGHVFLGASGPILAYSIDRDRVRMCFDLPTDSNPTQSSVAALVRARCSRVVPMPLRAAMLDALDAGPVEVCANHSVQTRSCIAPGAALIGDAGGCSHPLTATGMTRGLNDVAILAEELRLASDVDRALSRYESRRYRFVRPCEMLAEALYDVFRGDESGTLALRAGVFRYWDSSESARAASMALLSGEDSRLGSFAREYARVAMHSVQCVLRGEVSGPGIHERATSMSSLVRHSLGPLRRTLELTAGH